MDPRIREHAATIVEHSVDLQAGDRVVIQLPPEAEDLAVALYEQCGDRGAIPVWLTHSDRASRAYLRAAGEEYETPDHQLAFYEETDAFIIARGGANVTETSDVPPANNAAFKRAFKPVQEERLSKRWCLTQFPTTGHAQLAGMSTEAYQDFVWDAVSLDWEAQREFQAQLADRLDDADAVRIVAGEETDLRLRVAGNHALNDYGEKNLPGGEVFTAPVVDSVEGVVYFDLPLYRQGREIRDVRLRFEAGEVVDHSAGRNEALLTEILETDDGASRLGELGIGMNRAIDQFTYNMLFDEKMGDTVHLAVGAAYPETVGDENTKNESAEHVDMIVDMSDDARIEFDGEVVQRNGTFVFEDEFEA